MTWVMRAVVIRLKSVSSDWLPITPSRISWSWRDRQGHQAGDATSWAVRSRPVQMHGQFQEFLSLLGNQAAISAIPA